jgi:Flp pilus assembly protein TadG
MFDKAKAKFADKARRFLRIKTVRRFGQHEDGTALIEFVIVSGPFLLLVFAIMETAGVFFAGQALETATADSARLILTGQAQQKGFSQAQFKTAVCEKVYALFDCASGVYVDVKKYSSFSAIPASAKPIDANGKLIKNFTYDPGGPGCIVVVRLLYEWPVYLSLGLNLADLAGNKRLLVATSAFRTEPYATSGGC